MRRRSLIALYASASCLLSTTAPGASPAAGAAPNDTVAQAAPLEVGKVVVATNVGAITEAGDIGVRCPAPAGNTTVEAIGHVAGVFSHQATAWWRFRRHRPYTIVSTHGSSFDTTLVVWRRAPGGPLEVVGCSNDYGGSDAFSTVYLPRQGGPDGAPADPPGTVYYAQVGGCVVPRARSSCGAAAGTIRLGAYEGLRTKLGYRYFFTCKLVRLTSLRLTRLPRRARIVASVEPACTKRGCKPPTTKSRRVRGPTYDARRLIGVVRLRHSLDSLKLRVESAGRVTKVFTFFPGERGEAPNAGADCLPPGEIVEIDCGDPLTRFRDPPRLKCGRGSTTLTPAPAASAPMRWRAAPRW